MSILLCHIRNIKSSTESFLITLGGGKVQAQGGGQAIEDGAALGVLFDQLHEKGTIEARLRLLEQVRRNRASSVQILSNSSPPAPQSVRDAAARYLPDGKTLESMDDINKYLWSFDVIEECKAVLA